MLANDNFVRTVWFYIVVVVSLVVYGVVDLFNKCTGRKIKKERKK